MRNGITLRAGGSILSHAREVDTKEKALIRCTILEQPHVLMYGGPVAQGLRLLWELVLK